MEHTLGWLHIIQPSFQKKKNNNPFQELPPNSKAFTVTYHGRRDADYAVIIGSRATGTASLLSFVSEAFVSVLLICGRVTVLPKSSKFFGVRDFTPQKKKHRPCYEIAGSGTHRFFFEFAFYIFPPLCGSARCVIVFVLCVADISLITQIP